MPRIIRKIAFQPFLISMLVRSRTKPGPRLGLPPDSSNAPLLELVIAHRHPQFVRTLLPNPSRRPLPRKMGLL